MVVKEVRRVMSRKTFPLLIQDCALWAGESPRHVDLSFPSAFNRAVAGNRPDFRAFDPVKNFHEGTGMVARADQEMDPELLSRAQERAKTGLFWKDSNLILRNEIRRMYSVIMMALGLDPMHQSSWELILRCFPCCVLPFPEEHLLSHHYFAREFLFDRGDLEGNHFGHPLSAKTYNRILNEIDGEVAVDANGAYDRKADVSQGFAQKRRQRARKLVQDALDRWDAVLWGMFFALDNAAEYGHWVVDDKAKNIFRNNFNTALSEQGTLRMLRQIHRKELRAHFHPTELFKGELGQVSWAPARDLVKPVYEAMTSGGDLSEVSPMLGVYNCYNCAKSPKGDPQQISDPLTVFEFLNFSKRYEKQDVP
eukprot:g26924.t1